MPLHTTSLQDVKPKTEGKMTRTIDGGTRRQAELHPRFRVDSHMCLFHQKTMRQGKWRRVRSTVRQNLSVEQFSVEPSILFSRQSLSSLPRRRSFRPRGRFLLRILRSRSGGDDVVQLTCANQVKESYRVQFRHGSPCGESLKTECLQRRFRVICELVVGHFVPHGGHLARS